MDELTTKIAVSFLSEIFKEAIKGVGSLSSSLSNELLSHDVLGIAARRYRDHAFERFNVMKIFGMTDAIPLTNIYTRVQVLRNLPRNQRRTADDLQYDFEVRKRRRGSRDTTRPGLEVVNETRRIVLLGKPGAGKTTFLRHVLLQCLDEALAEKRISLLISLHAVANTATTLMGLLEAELALPGLDNPALFLRRLLVKGSCLLLLDGLDEVPEIRRSAVITEIAQLSDQYRHNKFIVSCRTAVYNYFFETFTEVEMADFEPESIRSFIFIWFRDDNSVATMCWQEIQVQPNIMELASVPLLLTMICLAYQETRTLSRNRAELYKDAVDALLKKWDNSRNRVRDEPYKQLTPRRKEDLFNMIAATTFEKDEFFFREADLINMIADYLGRLPGMEGEDLQDAAIRVLSAIEGNHGILAECARSVWAFAHLTFHEYFTASYVCLAGTESRANLVNRYLSFPKWREVFILVANMLPDADAFVIDILESMAQSGFGRLFVGGLRANLLRRATNAPAIFREATGRPVYLLDVTSRIAIEKEYASATIHAYPVDTQEHQI
jgi:predicted NACHT family NTPase